MISWQSDCRTLPKLRTFIQFKNFNSDSPHIFKPLSFMQRKTLSKFRLGMLHLHIETGRWARPRLPSEERLCTICGNGEVEDESHFLLMCTTYSQNRQILLSHTPNLEYFQTLNNNDKLKFLVNDPAIVKQTAKFIVASFELRSTLL